MDTQKQFSIKDTQKQFIKTDNNTIIHLKHIRWVKKMGDCLEVCAKSIGCNIENRDTHTICKFNSLHSYNNLNRHFE
jgi:hypothetical protein